MPNSYPEIKKFLGLFAQQNSFGMPDGAMERAMNIVINDDDVVTKLRGFYQYFSPGSGTIKAITSFQNKIIIVYSDKVTYLTEGGVSPNETGTETVLTGSPILVTGSRAVQFAESNGNLYFTTDTGVKVIDTYNGKVFDAGAPQGLDVNAALLNASGPFLGNNQINYRVLFGRRDANNNLILGAPSDILTLSNNIVSGCAYTSAGAGPYTVTVTSAGHNLSTGMTITVTSATDTDANGSYSVTATPTSSTFQYQTPADPTNGSLSWTANRAVLLEFSVPQSITTDADGWFYHIYRSSLSGAATSSAEFDFRLVDEKKLTSAQITSGIVTYEDVVEGVLVQFASELYTNPNSREGEDQANFQPPLCEDIAVWNNYLWFLNTKTRDILNLDIEDTSGFVTGDYLEFDANGVTYKYTAKSGVGNENVMSDSITHGADMTINYVAHGFVDGDYLYVSSVVGGSLPEGFYFVVSSAANTFKVSLTSGGSALASAGTTSLFFQGVKNTSSEFIFRIDTTSSSVALRILNTAIGIVKAVNRSTAPIAANYISSVTDVPGKMRFTSLVFGHQLKVRTPTVGIQDNFFPVLTTNFADAAVVKSSSDTEENAVFVSKIGEPWAVPVLNKVYAGSKNQPGQRVVALRNSVIILKEDGVFKVTGDTPINFSVTLIDNTVRIASKRSAATTANQVYFLASEGVCAATDSSVQILSRRIENRLENVVGLSNIDDQTAAVAYDTDRTYRICTIAPNETSASIVYLHNSINDTWTESDILFTGGAVGPGNVLFLISGNKILKERKKQNRIDYCGQNVAVTVISVASNKLSAVISMTGSPVVGDIIEKTNIFSRINAVTAAGANWTVGFAYPTNLVAADSKFLYRSYQSQWIMAPYHAGAVGREKIFSQMQIHCRTPSLTRLLCDFTNQSFGGDATTEWKAEDVKPTEGWGLVPWGLFSWGLEDGIRNVYNTVPAPIVRLYVPLFQARSTYIRAVLTHKEAGESIDAQAIAWVVRGYNERVTK